VDGEGSVFTLMYLAMTFAFSLTSRGLERRLAVGHRWPET
jgi:ABC-type amino acid transport system permease subunit